MTSLFSRLQKLNKEAPPPPWTFDDAFIASAPLVVECRNSLPAVLNLIEAAQRIADNGCGVIFGGRPPGFTCLDEQADAANPESRYAPEFREQVLAPDYPCLACQAKVAVAVFVTPEAIAQQEGETMFVITTLEPFRVIGPFKERGDAETYNGGLYDKGTIVELEPAVRT